MFETKCTKSFMEYIEKTAPDSDGFYYAMDFQRSSSFGVREIEASVYHLVEEKLLTQPFKNRPDIVMPTIYGMKYAEFRSYQRKHFFKYSILCPIIVTILTELIIHGSEWLLQLL